MAEIILTRPDGFKTDRLRAYQVYVDGSRLGKIRAGETERFQLSPGLHKLQLKEDWASSEKLQVDLGADDRAQFICAPRVTENDVSVMSGLRMVYWMTFGCRRYIDLQHGDQLPVEPESRSRWQTLIGPMLFGIVLLIGIAYWALTGHSVVVVGVVVAAMAVVVGGLVGRGIGKVAVQTTEEVQKRRDHSDHGD
jgi:hypothetical protein